MLTNSNEVPHEAKPSKTSVVFEEKKDGVLICHKYKNENHFVRDFKSNAVKNKACYLRKVKEVIA